MENVDNITDFTHLATNPAVISLAMNGCYYNKEQKLLMTIDYFDPGDQQLNVIDSPLSSVMTVSIERVLNEEDICDLDHIEYYSIEGSPGQMYLAAIQRLETHYVDLPES